MQINQIRVTFVVFSAVMLIARGAAAADLPSALVNPYLQIHAALAGDAFATVAEHAKAIEVAAKTLGPDADKILAGAKKLAAAKDIAAARTAFGELSLEITAYAEKTKSGFGPGVRVAYCPMVDKPWLQKDKELRNPYYGAAMLTCGSFKK